MIEQIMYFLLGVLLATLVALLVLPAVWHRAVRLTTKRVEAAVPVSLFEVQADKDQQRAFFALNQRRLELQLEEMRATIVTHAATIEAQRQRVVELESAVAELTRSSETTGAVAAERQVLVGELQDQVSNLEARIAGLTQELSEARSAHEALQGAHGTLSATAQGLTQSLAERDASLVDHGDRATALTSEIALLSTNLTATAQRLDVTSDLLEKERAAVARLTGELAAARDALAAKEEESAGRAATVERLSGERDQLTADLSIARGDLDANRAVLHAFELRRASEFADAETEARRITSALDTMRADHALMAGALEKARSGSETGQDQGAAADLAPVKAALADVAARIVALATRLEGEASPVPALLAHADSAQDNDRASGVLSLAGRIRALLDESTGASSDRAATDQVAANGSAADTPAAGTGSEDGSEDAFASVTPAPLVPEPAAAMGLAQKQASS